MKTTLAISTLVGLMGMAAVGCAGSSSSSSTSTSSSSGGGMADCSTRPSNHAADDSSAGTKAAVDAVTTADFTLTSGTAKAGKYCGNADAHAYWWKLAGAVTATNVLHLVVTFDRTTEANDVDFDVVYFDADGTGYTGITSCSAVSGVNEDCMSAAGAATTDVYVKTDTSTVTTQEGFNITLTKT